MFPGDPVQPGRDQGRSQTVKTWDDDETLIGGLERGEKSERDFIGGSQGYLWPSRGVHDNVPVAKGPHPFHPNIKVTRGIMQEDCSRILKAFFRQRRLENSASKRFLVDTTSACREFQVDTSSSNS